MQTSSLPSGTSHTLNTIIPALERAEQDLENEIALLEDEADTVLAEIQATVGGLSDLRYGKLANAGLKDEVLRGLEGLEGACS